MRFGSTFPFPDAFIHKVFKFASFLTIREICFWWQANIQTQCTQNSCLDIFITAQIFPICFPSLSHITSVRSLWKLMLVCQFKNLSCLYQTALVEFLSLIHCNYLVFKSQIRSSLFHENRTRHEWCSASYTGYFNLVCDLLVREIVLMVSLKVLYVSIFIFENSVAAN